MTVSTSWLAAALESISLVQNEHMNTYRATDPRLLAMHEHIYMAMIDTAEVVADRYSISRDAQDEYALQSQQRTAAGQEAGKFDDEIVPLPSNMGIMDKETKEISFRDITLEKDEGNRPTTTLEGLAGPEAGARRWLHYGGQRQPAIGWCVRNRS